MELMSLAVGVAGILLATPRGGDVLNKAMDYVEKKLDERTIRRHFSETVIVDEQFRRLLSK